MVCDLPAVSSKPVKPQKRYMETQHLHYIIPSNTSQVANTQLKSGYDCTAKCLGFLFIFKYQEEMDGSRAGSIKGQDEPGFLYHKEAFKKGVRTREPD